MRGIVISVLIALALAVGVMPAATAHPVAAEPIWRETTYPGVTARQLAGLWTPIGIGPFPGIVMVHGGGWCRGDKAYMSRLAAQVASAGYVVLNINYDTRCPGFPREVRDVEAAVSWMRTNALGWRVDPNRIAVWGHSAGANLAVQVATEGRVRVQAAVGYSGPYHLPRLVRQNPWADLVVRRYLGCSVSATPCRTGPATLASPEEYVDSSDPPVVLVNSRREITPLAQMRDTARELRDSGVPVREIALAGNDHGPYYGGRAAGPVIAFLDQYLK